MSPWTQSHNEALRLSAAAGYRVTSEPMVGPNAMLAPQPLQDVGRGPTKKPDAISEVEVFDVHSPETDKVRNVAGNIAAKVRDAQDSPAQAHRIVVNLQESPLRREQVIEQLALQVPTVDELEGIIFVDRNRVT